MTDDDFKRHLHRQLEEDKKNHGQLTNRIFAKPKTNSSNKYSHAKTNQKNPN
jgi:hypothetical protein